MYNLQFILKRFANKQNNTCWKTRLKVSIYKRETRTLLDNMDSMDIQITDKKKKRSKEARCVLMLFSGLKTLLIGELINYPLVLPFIAKIAFGLPKIDMYLGQVELHV